MGWRRRGAELSAGVRAPSACLPVRLCPLWRLLGGGGQLLTAAPGASPLCLPPTPRRLHCSCFSSSAWAVREHRLPISLCSGRFSSGQDSLGPRRQRLWVGGVTLFWLTRQGTQGFGASGKQFSSFYRVKKLQLHLLMVQLNIMTFAPQFSFPVILFAAFTIFISKQNVWQLDDPLEHVIFLNISLIISTFPTLSCAVYLDVFVFILISKNVNLFPAILKALVYCCTLRISTGL